MRRRVALLGLAALASCAGLTPNRQPVMGVQAFREGEYAAYANTGTASVAGQALMRTRGGEVMTCAGRQVVLIPDTEYTAEAITLRHQYFPTRQVAPMDPQLVKYVRQGICDAQGGFLFESLPAGKYFIFSDITWEIPSLTGSWGVQTTGGTTFARFALADGQQLKGVVATY